MEEWKIGRMEEWKIGRMEDWKIDHHSIIPSFHPSNLPKALMVHGVLSYSIPCGLLPCPQAAL
jgi:hypothetical protein